LKNLKKKLIYYTQKNEAFGKVVYQRTADSWKDPNGDLL
jgi:hypothetical protein